MNCVELYNLMAQALTNKIDLFIDNGTTESKNDLMAIYNRICNDVRNDHVYNCGKCNGCFDLNWLLEMTGKYIDGLSSKSQFEIEFYTWYKALLGDMLMSNFPKPNSNDFNYEHIQPSNKPKVYFDTSIFINNINGTDENYSMLKSMTGDFEFFYSPYHLEDIREVDDNSFVDKFKNLISEITRNQIILYQDNKLDFYIESPKYSYNRAIKDEISTIAAEEYRVTIRMDRLSMYPQYNDKNHKRGVNSSKSIFQEYSKELDIILKREGLYDGIDKIKKNPSEYLKSHNKLNSTIYTLSKALDIINFKMDKKENKIRSGLRDIEHLKCATVVDFFIVDDGIARKRANEIFKLLGIETQAIKPTEFIQMYYKPS